MDDRKVIGITMGDPASIGPEISVKALSKEDMYSRCRPLIIGDAKVMRNAVRLVGMEGKININEIKSVKDAKFQSGTIDVYDMNLVDTDELELGKISVMGGEAAFQYVKKVIELAMNGEVDATVTNALNKEAINLAGHHYSGHTEIYAKFTKTEKYTMMLAYENLRVVHVSTHVSLREACDRVKKQRVLDVIRMANNACKSLGISKPSIGVAGLNPHCGENGLFGTEEIEEIIPAIKEAISEGICVTGPIPPDTVFSKARGGWYDIVVAMYHDQGHIPLKVLGFQYDSESNEWKAVEGVNLTLGLPIIRTSVDHGTAFDHAGKGDANELSLMNAIDYAIIMTKDKKREDTI
ncbi:4-hydroxythreonine-4-phosphate dehydrogenase [Clostridium pascui]|uniref:4-hydroxythreonine-4-phosphate dehydrogenase PdxA n=1 Tax=Clostridium pascui TaxID=46609 RepID=UPI00195BB474|nr:4-hydroxythreonine-4-phosphate dehydrogenase PdxA [Clostridium pascui]MBM7871405.1 4-hydroxythreonine-4-phosphate dehydrogenase [Clostridium pascui]